MEPFITALERRLPLTEVEVDFVRRHLPVRTFAKGDYLLRAGEVSSAFFFNQSGLVRMFYLREGEEKTAYFYEEGEFVSAYESFTRREPARMSLQAVEETVTVEIGWENAGAMLDQFPKFEALARILMEEELIICQKIIASFVTQSPVERYEQLLAEKPSIFRRVPQHQIASFIGVQPETLSRIKRRATERKS